MNKIGFVFKSNIIAGHNISNENNNKIENNIVNNNIQGTNNDSKELAVAYLRVSTKEQEDEGYSLDNQERKAEEYAEKQNLKIVKIWKGSESAWRKVDGKAKDRKIFNEMIEYVKTHKEIKHIIFYSQDRMTRNMHDYMRLEKIREIDGITIHFSQTEQKQKGKLSSNDKMFARMKENFDEYFSDFISEKTAPAMLEKARSGWYPLNAPTGYLNAKDATGKKSIIIEDEQNSRFIIELFEKVASGNYSLEMMVDELYRSGFRHKKKGTKISKSSLYRMLRNPFYYGVFVYKNKEYKGNHPKLISKELWEKANASLSKFYRPHITKHNFPFSNLLVCDTCGCTILGEIQKKKHTYYRCSQARNRHSIKYYMKESELADKFGNIIKGISIPKNVGSMIKEGIKLIAVENNNINKNRASILTNDLKKSEKDLTRLYESEYQDIDISEQKRQFYKQKEKILIANIKTLKQELEKIGVSKDIILDKNEDIIELLTNLNKLYEICDNYEKAKIIKFILELSKLSKDNEIIPTYRKPFDLFCKINSTINSNNNELLEQKNNIGVKTDVILDNFNTKGYMPIYFCSNRSLKGG